MSFVPHANALKGHLDKKTRTAKPLDRSIFSNAKALSVAEPSVEYSLSPPRFSMRVRTRPGSRLLIEVHSIVEVGLLFQPAAPFRPEAELGA